MSQTEPRQLEPATYVIQTFPCTECGANEVYKPDHRCNECRTKGPPITASTASRVQAWKVENQERRA